MYKRQPYTEPDTICAKEHFRHMDVALPYFYMGCKIRPAEDPLEFQRQQYELEILHDLLAGSSSDFYEEMLEAGLLNSGFGDEVFAGRGFLGSLFGGESRDPKKVRDRFLEKVEEAKKNGFAEEDFLSAKNAMYGRMIRGLNDVENAASAMLNAEMAEVGLFETLDLLAAVTLADVEKHLDHFDPDRFALSVILPREGEYASLDQ